MNSTTQLINHLLTDKGDKGLANAVSQHRAVAASPSSPQAVSPLRASIDFRSGPAVEWLSDRCDLAHQLVEESKHD